MEKLKNKQISDKYQNFKQLGQGAVSAIYYAENKETSQPVAIKIVTKQKVASDNQENQYYQQELDITKAIIAKGKNENIVNILELIEGTEEYFIVTEYYKDGDLFNLLERFSFKFSPDIAISLCISIANGLNFLHASKICHRDLKPENILIAKQADDSFLIKIADFGISKMSEDMMKSAIGTITYMAPEVLRFQPYNEKVDIWSFGTLMYEIFTGEQLFAGNSVKEVALKITGYDDEILNKIPESKIPKSVNQIIKKCLKRQPNQRISLDQIIKDLLQAKAEMKISMTQSVLVQPDENDEKANQLKLDQNQEVPEQSKETNAEIPKNIPQFTDNLNKSIDNYTEETEEEDIKFEKQEEGEDSNQNILKQIPLQITKVESQNEQNPQEFDDSYFITPKNNLTSQKDIQNQQTKLKQLEEESKDKKMQEKAKNNLLMQQQIEKNQLLKNNIQNYKEINTQDNIEQSIVLGKKSNPNYVNNNIYVNMTPQPSKSGISTHEQYPHSDYKLYELKGNNISQLYNQGPSITSFNYIQSNFKVNENKPENIVAFPSSVNSFSQQNTFQYRQIEAKNVTPKISSEQTNQTYAQYQINQKQQNNILQINEPTYPSLDSISSFTTNKTNQEQKYEIPKSPQSSSKQFQDQVQINNKSEDIQNVLSLYASTSQQSPRYKNQKKEIKFNDLTQSEKQKINSLLDSYSTDIKVLFVKDQTVSKYQFKNKFFTSLNQELPCVEIETSEDINILDFVSFIFQSIEQQKKTNSSQLQKYIELFYKNKDYYIQLSSFIKENQDLIILFLKSLREILLMDSSYNNENQYKKLYEYTLSSKYQKFLSSFGSFLQIFQKDKVTQFLFDEHNKGEIQKRILQKIPFKLSEGENKKRYFIHFINSYQS